MIPRIYIVDDEAPARARLRMVLSDIAEVCPHIIVGEAEHAKAALDGIVQTEADVVLVDVQMPEINGLQMVAQLMQRYENGGDAIASIASIAAQMPLIIFITAYEHYAVTAFDVQAVDYLLKPVRATRLQQALVRASKLRFSSIPTVEKNVQPRVQTLLPSASRSASERTHFSVMERGRVLLVPVNDVRFLKAELKYVLLGTKSKEYLIEDSLISIESELCTYFVRVHRNALVARNAIIGVERGAARVLDDDADKNALPVLQQTWQVILRDMEQRLPISRRQWGIIRGLVRR